MTQSYNIPYKKVLNDGFSQGIILTLMIAVAAKWLAALPFFSIMGQLVLAIILGISWRFVFGVKENRSTGIAFSSKKLLRYGIILLGMRLNLVDIFHVGPKVFVIAVMNITFTILVVYGLTRWFKIDQKLGLLTACGTAICGAAAVVAIAPQLKANDNQTAISAATVAVLGTIFTLVYTLIYPFLGLSASGYGLFSGATLHEVAHVIAAAAPEGKTAVDMAVIVKLTRVALLVPVAILIGIWTNRKEAKERGDELTINWRTIPIPWFILGFLVMSGVNTFGIITTVLVNSVIAAAYFLIAMAMAGLGLNVEISSFWRQGKKTFLAGFIGSVLLSGLGFGLIHLFGLA